MKKKIKKIFKNNQMILQCKQLWKDGLFSKNDKVQKNHFFDKNNVFRFF